MDQIDSRLSNWAGSSAGKVGNTPERRMRLCRRFRPEPDLNATRVERRLRALLGAVIGRSERLQLSA